MIGSINSSSMIQSLFSKLDTSNKGYLEKSDLSSAFSSIASSTDTTSSIDNLFSALDDDSDGKVSSDEFSSNVSNLLQSLNAQMASGMKGMPPPPPPPSSEDDSGFSKEELQAQLEEIGSSDSQRSSLISSILENFDAADSDSDGKVSFQEAMAYGQSSDSTNSASTSSSSSTVSSDQELTRMLLQLMQAYGNDATTTSRISALA